MIIKINKRFFKEKIFFSLILISFLILSVIFETQKVTMSTEYIYGQWHGEIGNEKILFSLNNNNECILSTKDKILDDVFSIIGQCEFDFTKTPYSMRIISSQNKSKVYHTIVKILDSQTISIARVSTKWRLRPISFDKQSLILKKEGI